MSGAGWLGPESEEPLEPQASVLGGGPFHKTLLCLGPRDLPRAPRWPLVLVRPRGLERTHRTAFWTTLPTEVGAWKQRQPGCPQSPQRPQASLPPVRLLLGRSPNPGPATAEGRSALVLVRSLSGRLVLEALFLRSSRDPPLGTPSSTCGGAPPPRSLGNALSLSSLHLALFQLVSPFPAGVFGRVVI